MLSLRQFSALFIILVGADSCMRKKARIDVRCPEDQRKTAPAKATAASFQWSKSDFVIQSTYPVKGIYQTVPIYGASATVSKEFAEGSHRVEYKVVDETGKYDSCAFTLTTTVQRCPQIPYPWQGMMSCDAGNVYGSHCSVSCLPGYAVRGNSSLTCLRNGTWSSQVPSCLALRCADPGTPLMGYKQCTTKMVHSYGSVCSFACYPGYRLVGYSRLVCGVSETNQATWSNDMPMCQEIMPPQVDICPEDIQMSSGSLVAEVDKPEIRFNTSQGQPAQYTCSHFGSKESHNFTLGTHTVVCTAFDPLYYGEASTTCEFQVHIQANPCRSLPEPSNGYLLCSHEDGYQLPGGAHGKSCAVHCKTGYHMPWQEGMSLHDPYSLHCDATGQWLPYYFVPSCVSLVRPEHLVLPTEIVYTSSSNCSSTSQLGRLSEQFIFSVIETIRRIPFCKDSPGACNVIEQVAECRYQERPSLPSSRGRRYIVLAHFNEQDIGTPLINSEDEVFAFRDVYTSSLSRRRSNSRQDHHDFVIAVKFTFRTNVHQTTGTWPEEYHEAEKRLHAMFDYLDEQLLSGAFTIEDTTDLGVREVTNSLAFKKTMANCNFRYMFEGDTLLCKPCGAGTFLNEAIQDCELCPVGQYQADMAAAHCLQCPPGTTTMDEGANNISLCIDINECGSNPCQNGGVCDDGTSSYTCVCPEGFSGVHCEELIFDCKQHACRHGGSCIPLNETEYLCECRTTYYGDLCQYQSIHGHWGEWGEWTECSVSCEGGEQQRSRLCDSPPPSTGGDNCTGAAVEERVCNAEPCPECSRLHRPYGGDITCKTNQEIDLISCTIGCPPRHAFSGPVLDVYHCGQNTSFLWPHQSPDNPRSILPECTEIVGPVAEAFTLEASLTAPCSESARQEIARQVRSQAARYTESVQCFLDGSCSLALPDVSPCSSTSRRKRRAQVQDLKVKVSVLYNDNARHSGGVESVKAELGHVTKRLKSRTHDDLSLNVSGVAVDMQLDEASAQMSAVCPVGAMATSDSNSCVICARGTYYKEEFSTCLPCEEGWYQPKTGQSTCLRCPDNKTTYGRGAIRPIECYNGTIPPEIPEDTPIPMTAEGCDRCGVALAVCIPVVAILLLFLLLFILYRRRKENRKRRYRISKENDQAASEVMLTNITSHQNSHHEEDT